MGETNYFDNFKNWVLERPSLVKLGFNIWPPFFFTGITVKEIAKDYKSARLKLAWSKLTKNINGTQFGGSLFSMTDPIYVTLLLGILGHEKYYIWDKNVTINYIHPGVGPVFYEPKINDELIEEIKEKTAAGEKFEPVFVDQVYDSKGATVAEVERTIYIRLKRKFRPEFEDAPDKDTLTT